MFRSNVDRQDLINEQVKLCVQFEKTIDGRDETVRQTTGFNLKWKVFAEAGELTGKHYYI